MSKKVNTAVNWLKKHFNKQLVMPKEENVVSATKIMLAMMLK